MIESPPKIKKEDLVKIFFNLNKDKEINLLVEQINDKYEYWSDVKYKKIPDKIDHKDLWTYVKAVRLMNSYVVWEKYDIKLCITNKMQRMCHEFDMNFGGSWGANSIIPEDNREQYLISSIMEEAISSSQMEGASTTRKIAKDMLRTKVIPKDNSQQMIFNNYQTIQFIVKNKDVPLSQELFLKVHSLMTDNTLDNPEDSGRFRDNNNVVVENGITHETIHTPPIFEEITEFIDTLCVFFNEDKADKFIHPIIRGIVIHFMIAYIHPFVDGNGRTARALFYWYMLKRGYWLTEYLSISRVIIKSKKTYEKAYLYTENDENDIGYFVNYNLNVLDKAFKEFQKYINKKNEEKKQANMFLHLGNINERQAGIIKIFYDNPKEVVTVKCLQNKFSVTATTIKNDIVDLIKRDLLFEISFNKVKKGYIKSDRFDDIIKKIIH